MRTKYLTLLLLTLSGVFIISMMYWTTSNKSIRNGFSRLIVNHKITNLRTIEFDSENLYFAGWIGDILYLGDARTPFRLLAISDSARSVVTIDNKISADVRHSKISVDSPEFQLADLDRFNIYRGNVSTWDMTRLVHSRQLFSEELPLGPNSVILRDLNKQNNRYILSKEVFDPFARHQAETLIERQIDGLFCTDGMLRFDRSNALLTYIYFYRNQFFVSDTSLNLILRGRTIDTVTRANIKVAFIDSENYRTIASPPKIVNRASFAANGKFYVNSNLIADNEERRLHRKSDVIDIYDLFSGQYEHSFYIPRVERSRLRHFCIKQSTLYVLNGSLLTIYTFNSQQGPGNVSRSGISEHDNLHRLGSPYDMKAH